MTDWPHLAVRTDITREALRDELLDVVRMGMEAHPRSAQRALGPSDIADPCDVCLGRKILGLPRAPSPYAWEAQVGTFMHAGLEAFFDAANANASAPTPHALVGQVLGAEMVQGTAPSPREEWRWLTETRVRVGDVDGVACTGTSDLYDRHTATVVDWKSAGPSVLKAVKAAGAHGPGGAKAANAVQAQLYGRGFLAAGLPVTTVALFYLPRNGPLREGHLWTAPFEESVAVAALDRATGLTRALAVVGEPLLASLTSAPGCMSCARSQTPASGGLSGLVA